MDLLNCSSFVRQSPYLFVRNFFMWESHNKNSTGSQYSAKITQILQNSHSHAIFTKEAHNLFVHAFEITDKSITRFNEFSDSNLELKIDEIDTLLFSEENISNGQVFAFKKIFNQEIRDPAVANKLPEICDRFISFCRIYPQENLVMNLLQIDYSNFLFTNMKNFSYQILNYFANLKAETVRLYENSQHLLPILLHTKSYR